MDRRSFLLKATALGCSAAASPLMTPVAFADAPGDNRLVVIILRGAMDGIDAFRPIGDPAYAALRPKLNDGQHIDLDGFWGLHPALSPLLPLWQAGEVGAVHATSTPYRDKRSHFDGQDILEAGVLQIGGGATGWLNRLLTTMPDAAAETAYAIGRTQMPILSGPAAASRWSPDANLQLSGQAQRLLEIVYHDDPLFRDAAAQAIEIAALVKEESETAVEDPDTRAMMEAVQSGGVHVNLAEFAAGRLRGDTRIASFSLAGWDTHQNQKFALNRALGQLSDTLLTLRAQLGPVWQKTAVLCLTEFGRTAFENGTRGTDHGTGGAMLYAGGAMRGGAVRGRWPGLDEAALYDRRDVMPTTDVRALAGWVIRGLFGTAASDITQTIFPGLDLGDDPGLLL